MRGTSARRASPAARQTRTPDDAAGADKVDTSGNIAALKRRGFRVVATYDYHDECGQLLYQNVRLEHFAADGKRDAKTFRQRRPKEGVPGAFIGYLGDVRRVPFRLPAIAEAKHQAIDIAEGEKDADRLASLGLLATSVATPSTTDLSAFAGHAIYIHANNDAPGRKKAKKLAKLLEPIAADVFIVSYPDTGPGGDVSDWLDQGNGLDELLVRRGEAPPFFATHDAGDVGEFRAARADEIYWPEWEKGEPRSRSAANIRAFLTHAGVALRRNEFTHRDEITRDGKTEPLSDAIVVALRLEAHALGLDPPEAFFNDVVNNEARAHGYHPVRDYLASIAWDGTPRLDTLLIDYAGAPDTALNRAFGRKTFVAAVRRVRQPGCKHDSCLVLEGPQGSGKSSLVRTLASPAWFTDCVSIGAEPKCDHRADGRLLAG